MKISLMVLLILTIAELAHFAMIGSPKVHEATVEFPGRTASVPPRSAIGTRNMWISIFAAVTIGAACIGIAAFLMQPAELT